MGLFSSDWVTSVGTSVSRVISDDLLPNATRTALVKSLFQDGNPSDYVTEELATSVAVRAERMYRYAENHYTYGMPSGEIYSSTQGRAEVEAIIEAAEGQQVLMEYSHFGPPNALHIGWIKLVNQYGYSQATNQLATLTAAKGGKPVYLHNMVVVVPESMSNLVGNKALEQWGTAASSGYTPYRPANVGSLMGLIRHSPIQKSSAVSAIQLLVTYVWRPTASSDLEQESLVITLSGYDLVADYFQAKYLVGGQAKYWIYKNDSGTYPTLDNVYVGSQVVSGEYFPFAYFRFNKQSTISNKTTPGYQTSKKMLKYLGMDFDTIGASLDENPNLGDVEQALLVMAVPASSTNPIECRYLFDYFDNLHYSMGESVSTPERYNLSNNTAQQQNSIVIQDARFKMALGNDGIYKHMVAGSIGSVGAYSNAYGTITTTVPFYNPETGELGNTTTTSSEHRYRHQVAPGLYEEVVVVGLTMTYFIYGNYSAVADENDKILLIPIDRSITTKYTMGDRETLYSRSLHFVFNSRTVTEVKWYQQSWFRAFLIVVAVVITVYSYGADGGSAIATALGISGAAGLIATIVVNLVIGQLIAVGFEITAKAVGSEVATALAVVALLAGGYQVIQAGGLSGAPWAQALLEISTGLQKAAMALKYSDLLADADSFNKQVEEATKLLETANDLLDQNNLLSPLVIFGEAPQDFYNRTVHSANIGVAGINAISSYVDIALTLPKLKDTLGEELYVN
jgi:hypothetical protein